MDSQINKNGLIRKTELVPKGTRTTLTELMKDDNFKATKAAEKIWTHLLPAETRQRDN